MMGAPLIRDEVVQVCQPREKRLLVAAWVVKPFHGEYIPLDGVMGLTQKHAGHRHLGVCEHGIPARLLLLHPVPHACAVSYPSRGGDVVRKAPQPLAERKHAQALALACPVEHRVWNGVRSI
jgi:hypothetical protein